MAGGPGLSQGLPDGQSDPEGERYVSVVPWSGNPGSHPLACLGALFAVLLLATSPALGVTPMAPHAGEFKPRSLTFLSQHIIAEESGLRRQMHLRSNRGFAGDWSGHLGKGLSDPVSLYFKKR